MEKEVCLADITTLSLNNKIYGHFYSVAKQYNLLFKNENFKVLGGATYQEYTEFENNRFYKLPFFIKKEAESKILKFAKELINAMICVNHRCDALVFQSYSKLPIYISLALCNPKSKVYMIEYQYSNKKGITGFFRKIALKKVKGIITSTNQVGEAYGRPYVKVQDYIYTPSNIPKAEKKYDFAMLGTIASDKDYEDVIFSCKNKKFRVLLAGKFLDSDRLRSIESIAGDNIEIINEYLSDDDYYKYIRESKFIVLPYIPSTHTGKSSGVVLDSIYQGTPVIATNIDTFSFVKKYNLGILYSTSFQEVIESEQINYSFDRQIDNYLNQQYIQTQALKEFILSER